ncbi:MAG: polysaccharide deacetylase [Moraxellaceae bacterium]|jgi:hypothetical protein|nr:polysaccharide deacetylase [Moraxellaceae bacterium]
MSRLRVRCPEGFAAERQYVLEVMFGEFLGLDCVLAPEERSDYRVELPDGSAISWPDLFFADSSRPLLDVARLPVLAVPRVRFDTLLPGFPEQEPVPLLYAQSGAAPLLWGERVTAFGFDLAGAIFFQLTRFEEAVSTAVDGHGRFPATAALAVQGDWIDRPLVDEYITCLRLVLEQAGVACRASEFRLCVSHDVDLPFAYHGTPWRYRLLYLLSSLRAGAGPAALRELASVIWRGAAADPCNTFDWIMTESERRGLTSAFYFITDRPAGVIDGYYAMSDPAIRSLVVTMRARGHELGLHASYGSWQSPEQFQKEAAVLHEAVEACGGALSAFGGRQHYLRWRTPASLQGWERAGAAYDSSMGFAEVAGFRAGTAREYPWFDLAGRRRLRVRERPLIVMDCTLTDDHYMGLGRGDAALAYAARLKERCRLHGGTFALLWHNSRLVRPDDRLLYTRILDV